MPRSYRLARILSDLLSPPVIALAVFWVRAGAGSGLARTLAALPLTFMAAASMSITSAGARA
jgi:hypothetical protein